jgi:hypothetical protein
MTAHTLAHTIHGVAMMTILATIALLITIMILQTTTLMLPRMAFNTKSMTR